MDKAPLDPMIVPTRVLASVQSNPVGFAVAGIGYTVMMFAVVCVLLAMVFAPMLPGLGLEDEGMVMIGGLVGFVLYTVGMLTWLVVLIPTVNASLLRALDRQYRGEGPIGLGSLVDTMTEDMGRVVLFQVISQCLVLVGALFCYLPGIVAMVVCMFAAPLVILEGASPAEALGRAFEHIRAEPVWHLATWGVMWVGLTVVQVTLIGIVFVYPLMFAFQLHAYHVAFDQQAPA